MRSWSPRSFPPACSRAAASWRTAIAPTSTLTSALDAFRRSGRLSTVAPATDPWALARAARRAPQIVLRRSAGMHAGGLSGQERTGVLPRLSVSGGGRAQRRILPAPGHPPAATAVRGRDPRVCAPGRSGLGRSGQGRSPAVPLLVGEVRTGGRGSAGALRHEYPAHALVHQSGRARQHRLRVDLHHAGGLPAQPRDPARPADPVLRSRVGTVHRGVPAVRSRRWRQRRPRHTSQPLRRA